MTHGVSGLLVELNDHQAIADCAFRLLEDSDLVETLTRNGRDELEKYRWNHVRAEWLKLYHELMNDSALEPARRRSPLVQP